MSRSDVDSYAGRATDVTSRPEKATIKCDERAPKAPEFSLIVVEAPPRAR
jgi:hypothetical protein